MMYNITIIEPDGATANVEFSSKNLVQRWIRNNNNYFPIEKIERVTKKETRDVTELFEIQYLADSSESVEPEENLNEELERELKSLKEEIIANMTELTCAETLIMVIEDLIETNDYPSFLECAIKINEDTRNFCIKCIKESEDNIKKFEARKPCEWNKSLLDHERKWLGRNRRALKIANQIDKIIITMKRG